MPTVTAALLPELLDSPPAEHTAAVVIDVLRASTTIIHALAAGAATVAPCLTIEDARHRAASLPPGSKLLGGERHGRRIEGFDLGNSPFEYLPNVVRDRTVVFTTTNGTKALMSCRDAAEVYIGAFVNRAALVQQLQKSGRDVVLVCAGTDGRLTAEDILFAGAVTSDLSESSESWAIGNVQSQMACDFYRSRARDPELFREAFRNSLGGLNLRALGMQADIERALEVSLFDLVPHWDRTRDVLVG